MVAKEVGFAFDLHRTATTLMTLAGPLIMARGPDLVRAASCPALDGRGGQQVQAVSPAGSDRPFARQQAVSVFASRQAIVMGPTPPGTGVIAPATEAQLS